jgi:hypothetical protein
MIILKQIDAFGQTLLLAISATMIVINGFSEFYVYFFVIGAWQLLSLIWHRWFARLQVVSPQRTHYAKTLLALFALGLMAAVSVYAIIPFLLLLTAAAPVLAVWYNVIVFSELQTLQHRLTIKMR